MALAPWRFRQRVGGRAARTMSSGADRTIFTKDRMTWVVWLANRPDPFDLWRKLRKWVGNGHVATWGDARLGVRFWVEAEAVAARFDTGPTSWKPGARYARHDQAVRDGGVGQPDQGAHPDTPPGSGSPPGLSRRPPRNSACSAVRPAERGRGSACRCNRGLHQSVGERGRTAQ